jgi:hypothetical protein
VRGPAGSLRLCKSAVLPIRHLLVRDEAHELTPEGPRFRTVPAPTAAELEALPGRIVGRIARHLEQRGLVVRDAENTYRSFGPDEDTALEGLLGHSITDRIAVGPNEGRKAATRCRRWPRRWRRLLRINRVARNSGFSLHAGVAVAPHQRDKVERLCRQAARPPVAAGRLALTAQGLVRYALRTPYQDGTTNVVLEPAKLRANIGKIPVMVGWVAGRVPGQTGIPRIEAAPAAPFPVMSKRRIAKGWLWPNYC